MSMPRFLLERFIAAALVGLVATAALGQVPRVSPAGSCGITSLGSAVGITATNCVFAQFTATLGTDGTLNVTAVSSGVINTGQPLTGTGVPAAAYVSGQISGTIGGVGVYRVANPPTTAITSESMTTAGIPVGANYALICAYTQSVNYKPDGTTPTATPGSGGTQIPATGSNCIGATTTFSKLQFIQQTASASLSVDFYVWQ
jgi:hypothetical protein